MRVVSLVPSATETLAAWGVEPVACTRFCERPDLAQVGGPKNPDIAAIIALAPDVVVMDRQENRRQDAAALSDSGLQVVVLDVRSIEGLHHDLVLLADAVGAERPGPIAVEPTATRLTAFVPIWRRPWMTIGPATYGSSVLAAIGARNAFDDAVVDYPEVSIAAVARRAPDAVLVPSEPYAFDDEHLDELAAIAPVARVDGQDLFWWGARTAAAVDRLRAQVAAL